MARPSGETVAKMTNFQDRLTTAYAKRGQINSKRYSLENPGARYMYAVREAHVERLFGEMGIADLAGKRILDVGCGSGSELHNLIRYGATPEKLSGIDMLPDRVAAAKASLPSCEIVQGDGASGLPWADNTFDLALQFTVFTSIIEPEVKAALAKEILRVIKPGVFLLWYDFQFDNPTNKDVKGVKLPEIVNLFPGCKIQMKRITLAPPISRAIAPISTRVCSLLEKLVVLNTHYIGYIQKP